ncbi:MAG: SPFH/Band 7/PHB domain protein [Actinobacteria bacterium]|nr:MAG: SPFH/Band 7/PHB domain protein [Actinomycetota bacterium]
MTLLFLFFWAVVLLFMFIMVVTSVKIVPQGYVGILERMGRYVKSVDAGMHMLMPFVTSMRIMSLKERVDEYAPQAVITSDNAGVKIDAVLYFQVVDAAKSIYEVENYIAALEILTMTTLRDIIGEMTLDDCLTSREKINARLRGVLDEATEKWGIKVNRVEIRTIEPPEDIRLAMEKQMRAERDKRAAILEAEGQKQSSVLRAQGQKASNVTIAEGEKDAAILRAKGRSEAYTAMFKAIKNSNIDDKVVSIKYLETLEKVAQGDSNTIILPYNTKSDLSVFSGIGQALGINNKGKKAKKISAKPSKN